MMFPLSSFAAKEDRCSQKDLKGDWVGAMTFADNDFGAFFADLIIDEQGNVLGEDVDPGAVLGHMSCKLKFRGNGRVQSGTCVAVVPTQTFEPAVFVREVEGRLRVKRNCRVTGDLRLGDAVLKASRHVMTLGHDQIISVGTIRNVEVDLFHLNLVKRP